ncbi:MAG: MerR family DNA-binding transcriptional regulator [Parcubacteria group bacterium]|nr:MerR family DNA-binding transcriptional regulator [Parcubacteria group bacterium]
MSKQYLTIREAAQMLGVSTVTLRNWDKRGLLAAARNPANNYRLYARADIEDFLERIEEKKPKKLHITFIPDETEKKES